MSIKAISWVWQNSKQKGGALLLELAIADFADDQGRAWPAIATLAVKARMTPRNVNLVIEKKLKPAGLIIKQNAGPHQTNLFQLPIHGGEKISALKDFQDEARFLEPLKPASANPSLNRHNKNKSSTNVLSGADAPPLYAVVKSSKKKIKPKPATIPPELRPAVSKIIGRLNELAGTVYETDSKIVQKGLVARLKAGKSELDCLAVVEDRWCDWENNSEMRQYFNPETLFRETNFDKYLNAARMNAAASNNSAEWRRRTFING
jgi:uncharacterized phage protein (TIGR02220 family)